MNAEQLFAFAVLGGALVLFVWGRWRYDLVAVVALLAAVFGGVVPFAEAFSGFAHPAVVTVAAVLVISRALQNAGVVDLVGRLLGPLKGRETLQLAAQTFVIVLLSGFMNNVGALALMLPVALRGAYRDGYAPAKVLMPLAFGSLLGGLTTLIGTPPNIIVSAFRAEHLGRPYAMFDFTPVGAAVAAAGLLFIVLLGWRLIPRDRKGAGDPQRPFEIDAYVAEARVRKGAQAIGRSVGEIETLGEGNVTVAGLIRRKKRRLIPSAGEEIRQGDILILEGDPADMKSLADAAGLKFLGSDGRGAAELTSDDVELQEVFVTPQSRLLGRSARSAGLRARYGMNLLALARQGQSIRARLGDVTFRSGDILLVQGGTEARQEALSELGLLPLAERSLNIGRPRRLLLALTIFAAAIAATVMDLMPIHIAFLAAAVLLVLVEILRPNEVYQAVDWPVVVLLGAMIPVGRALEDTGALALAADALVAHTAGFGAVWVLVILLVATMALSDVINNNATAVLMAPLALGIADRLGVNADPFLMAVAIGASCAFLTPIGHQSNTLVMEPGGYRFGDYWRLGLPLEAVIAAVAVPMILWVWPL